MNVGNPVVKASGRWLKMGLGGEVMLMDQGVLEARTALCRIL